MNPKQMNEISNEIVNKLFKSKNLRREALGKDILWFMSFYFTEYLQYKTAPFQKEILKLIQNLDHKFIEIIAFRGSAKSTYCSLVLPIFSVVGKHQKKHIVLVGQTQSKSEQSLLNIRQVWESSELLMRDFGPIRHETDPWNQTSLVFGHYGAKITAISVERSPRGIIHGRYRPDLIICDDIEDVASAKTMEARDKLWQYINAELIPAGDINTNFIFIGNLVHEDSSMMRLKTWIEKDKIRGICKTYPLLDESQNISWLDKFPNLTAIDELKRNSPSEIDFLREYLLKIIPDGDRVIFPQDINRYKEEDLIPRADFKFYLVLIDPAVSLKHTADNTAIITARVYENNGKINIYITPNPTNNKLSWPEIIKEVERIVSTFDNSNYKVLIEGGSSQGGLVQMLQDEGFNAEEVLPHGNDKKTRLSMLRVLLQNKTILFPEVGTETLESQMIFFGTEKHDDLADALTLISLNRHNLVGSISSGAEFIDNSNFDISNNSKDWGEKEDEIMLGTVGRGWTRIYG